MTGTVNYKHLLFIFSISVLLLHVLRNLTVLYYFFIVISSMFFLIFSLKNLKSARFFFTFLTILFLFLYVFLVSFYSGSEQSPYTGLVRLFLLAPLLLFLFSSRCIEDFSVLFLWIVLYFIMLASLSLLWQYVFGSISFFADSSERAGTMRYASLAGSLTAFGGVVGLGIIAANMLPMNPLARVFCNLILLVGAVLSLQKMAIAYCVFAYVLVFIYNLRVSHHGSVKLILVVLPALLLFPLLAYWILAIAFPGHAAYFLAILGDDARTVGDVSLLQSMGDRLVSLPLRVYDYWGGYSLFFGVGVFGGAGGLGYRHYPMAHNLLFETLAIFGVFVGGAIVLWLAYLFMVCSKLLITTKDQFLFIYSSICLSLICTSLFSGALFYHPAIAVPFWFSVSEVYRRK